MDKVLDGARGSTTGGHRDSYANAFENSLEQFDVGFSQAVQVLNLYSLTTRRKLGEESACPIKDWHFFITGQDKESDMHGKVTRKDTNVHDRMGDVNIDDETV